MDKKVQHFANHRKHYNVFGNRKQYKSGILKDKRVKKEGRDLYKFYR